MQSLRKRRNPRNRGALMYGCQNIEKSGFHKGQYVGYAPISGAWEIRKNGKSGWIAVNKHWRDSGPGIIFGDRLKDISNELRTR